MKPTATLLIIFLTSCTAHPCREYLRVIPQQTVSGQQFFQGFHFHYNAALATGMEPCEACDSARVRMTRWVVGLGAQGIGDLEKTEWIVPLYGRDLIDFETRMQ